MAAAAGMTITILVLAAMPSLLAAAQADGCCKAWLVQSIPTDMPDLRRVPGVLATGDVLLWLARNATKDLDILAQYWQLLAQPENPNSGDYGFTDDEMAHFGADQGLRVYSALENAADRGVSIRIVQHTGVAPDYDQETADLASKRPNVQNRTLQLGNWWGSGIVHAKVWISDKKDLYIGSANNDWKSLTQVKEVGIYIASCPHLAKIVETYFDNLYKLTSLDAKNYTRLVWDKQWQAKRRVPCWSHFLHRKERCRSPLPPSLEVLHMDGYPEIYDPQMINVHLETPGCNFSASGHYSSYLSFSPPELLFGKFQADEQGWVDTIRSVNAGGVLRMNTMDWLGQSQYISQTVYWASLSSAISEVVFSKNATVRIIVAYWRHFIPSTHVYLKNLLYTNVLCRSSKYNTCDGRVEIRYCMVPGFSKTGRAKVNGTATKNLYPDYTRVNHAKYAVSDVRANIGTSNLVWDYFYTTAGVSFGTYNPCIVSQLQDIFDADWNSPYTKPVELMQLSSI